MKKCLVLIIIFLLCTVNAYAARQWTLAEDKASTGVTSKLEHPSLESGGIELLVQTKGAVVNIAFQVYENNEEVPTLTFTSTTAEKVKYVTNHGMSHIKIGYTITSGKVVYIKVRTN